MAAAVVASPLQLRHLVFSRVCVAADFKAGEAIELRAPEFDFEGVEIRVRIGVAALEEENPDPRGYRVDVELQIPNAPGGERRSPYSVDVHVQGWFEVVADLPAERRLSIVEVNGASMVIGAIRDEVARITSRSAFGTLTLPTLRIVPEAAPARTELEAPPSS